MNDSNEINLLIVENIDSEEDKKDDLIKDDLIKDDLIKDDLIKDDLIKDDLAKEDLIKDDLIKEDQAKEDQAKEDQAKEEQQKEEKEKNLIYFAIGVRNPTNYGNQRKRNYISDVVVRNNKKIKLTRNELDVKLTNKKKLTRIKIQKKPPVQQQQPNLKKLAVETYNLFEDVNPYYTCTRIDMKLNDKRKKFELPTKNVTKTNQIKIIIPKVEIDDDKTNIYHYLSYQVGTLFDWQLTLIEIDCGKTLFNFPTKKKEKSFKFRIPPTNQILAYDVHAVALEIYENNQWVRWQMKTLLNAWLVKKSKQRCIGEDCDLLTGGEIPKDEQIRVISIKSRTEYVFSGAVLTKSAKTCLEGQTGAIPFIKSPHNPFTNTPFSYGEMAHVYLEILRWCGSKGKTFPAILGLYREAKFRNNIILRMNNNYVQLKAVHTYIINDDTTGEFFIEIMELLLGEFALLLVLEFNTLMIGYQRFRLWNKMEPKNYLIVLWKRLAADYWYFRQTEQFSRENWRSESSIYMDLQILMRASTEKLTHIMTEYYRNRHYTYEEDDDEI